MASDEGWGDIADSALWRAVQQWHPEPKGWLEAALPRLPETVRVNPLRDDVEWTKQQLTHLGGEPIEWLPEGGGGEGWLMPWLRGKWPDSEAKMLLSALHDSGRITRQEAVSMIPVKLLECKSGHHLLDLCAAPGSKSTQLAEAINDEGVVVANESNPGRANLLVSNCKRAGVTSMVITRHDGRHLPRSPNPGFDRILVDAPCSGSATTRKNPELWKKWSERAGRMLHPLQVELLRKGARLLAPGGRMVYSTCSYDPVENEAVVAAVLRASPWLELVPTGIEESCPKLVTREGMREWVDLSSSDDSESKFRPPEEQEILDALHLCRRIWSGDNDAGGFFVAAFRHRGESEVAEALLADSEMAEKHYRQPPTPTKNDEVLVSSDILAAIRDDWGVEYQQMFTRGSRIYSVTDATYHWLYSSERMLRRGGRLPGGHWHPFHVVQAGLPTWEMRKGVLQRPTSKGIHLTAPRLTSHVHDVGGEMLTEMVEKGGWEKEDAVAEIPTLESERGGAVILRFTDQDVTWWIPAWLGGKLTLMLPDPERALLRHALSLEVAP